MGLLCSPIRDAAQRQQKDDGNAKGEYADCGSKAMLRVCNSTNKDDRYHSRKKKHPDVSFRKIEPREAEWRGRRKRQRENDS